MLEIWRLLPDTYRYPDPYQKVNLWRGDKMGKAVMGMSCRYDGDPVKAVLEASLLGEDEVSKILINQVATAKNSPVISASNDVRLAQFFAKGSGETLYGITLPAHRVIRDPLRFSDTKGIDTGAEMSEEVFIIGNVSSCDITSMKINNDDTEASERLVIPPSRRFRKAQPYEAYSMSDFKGVPIPNQPNPKGIWKSNL